MLFDYPVTEVSLAIAQRTVVLAGPNSGYQVLKEIMVNNPGLGGRRPVVPTTAFAVAAGPAGRFFYSIGNGGSGVAIVEVSSDPDRDSMFNTQIVAGSTTANGTTDSTDPYAARFSTYVAGMCYNAADGRLYIADTNNNKIRWMDVTTYEVGTLAGSGVSGQADATGASATFVQPRSVAVNPAGTILYVGQTAASPAVSIRAITLPGAVVTTLASSAMSSTSAGCDCLSVSADGAWIWYGDRDSTGARLKRYSIAGASSLTIFTYGASAVAGTNAATEVVVQTAVGTSSSGLWLGGAGGTGAGSGNGSICADPNDPLACFILETGNTVSSSNYVRRVRLSGGTAASPTYFTSHFFAGNGSSAGTARGNGILGVGSLIGTVVLMANQAADKEIPIVYGGSSGALLLMDSLSGTLSEVIGGSGVIGSNTAGNSAVGHEAYLSLAILDTADAIASAGNNYRARLLYDRLPVQPGETLQLSQNLSIPPGKKLVATAHNAPLHLVLSSLTGEV